MSLPLSLFTVQEITLSESQLTQLNSFSHELADLLEDGGEIPNDLLEEISSLPDHGLEFLLRELQSQLSDEGVFKMCSMLCEEGDREPWINIPIVFQHFILPKVRN